MMDSIQIVPEDIQSSSSSSNIKAVICDLDGTIIDSMWVWMEVDKLYLMEKKGIHPPKGFANDLKGMTFIALAHYFKKRFDIEDSVEQIVADWVEMARHQYTTRVTLKPGAKELLRYLNDLGIPIALGTANRSELVHDVLRRLEVEHFFSAIACGNEVKQGKPNPDIFHLALAKINEKISSDTTVGVDECLVFEDSFAGCAAAHSANMKCIGVFDKSAESEVEDIRSKTATYLESLEDLVLDNQEICADGLIFRLLK